MKYVWGFLAVLFVAVGALTLRPDLLPGAESWVLRTPMAHVMALRPWLAIVFAGVAAFLLIFAAIRRSLVGSGRIALATSLAYLVMAVFHGGTLYARGIQSPAQLGPDHGVTAVGEGNGQVTVLSFNTLGGSIVMADLADSVVSNGVDVLVLTETSTAGGEELVGLLADRGLTFRQFDTGTDRYATEFESTVVLVSDSLGEYSQVAAEGLPGSSVVVVPANGHGPKIIGVHPFAPAPAHMDRWKADISAIYGQCADTSFIMAGDFNSTVDHQMVLGADCADARIEAGAGGLGTWPSAMPALLGTPIDRVLTDGSYRGVEASEVASGGSDHRGIIVRLAPAD
ncbi:endonuclease/exonuclease/phosphatase family protein [Trueperella abortisuis]|uniref:Endonuclease/exonuclease/phosphatase (EEP) superfamily protein YafD n=1 Tax=Trueperella abortisuis TaxID=445930 RepID=A0ABT9PH58_9ACTO|nr:endonuclease/exonuclease/phosphatase family protein [Trueperella abortisuis]MDP9831480.1 endonuclease/exonuclease/phosphatase (EEP) superfamily protein YafD [Trueperella abortisuis]